MLEAISLILVFAGLAVIIFIILKKFPSLAILDVENIPGEKENKFKEKIIRKRLARDLASWRKIFNRIGHFFNLIFSVSLSRAYNSLKTWREKNRQKKGLTLAERREHIRDLLAQAADNIKTGVLDQAEAALIEVVSLEPKNLPAFVQLAAVYAAGKKWEETRQTLDYALHLAKAAKEQFAGDITQQEIYFSLATANQNRDDLKQAIDNIRDALEFEPNNPRFLDLALNLALAANDKEFATALLERLKEANPDNAKLADWTVAVAALKTASPAPEPEAEQKPIE